MKNNYFIRLLFVAVILSGLSGGANAQNKREGRNNGVRQGGGITKERINRPNNDARTPSAGAIERRNARIRNNNNNNVTINRQNNTVINRPGGVRNNIGYGPGNSNNRPRFGTVNRPAYRPVYGTTRPVYSAVNPGWGYGYLPRRNAYYSTLPSTYLTINFGGFGYRYWNGVFYRPYNNMFTVIAPPVGIFINVLPVGYRTIYVRDYPYYYYNGTYYDRRQDNYYVVSPPVGAVVESLPAGYQTVVIDGETYYTIDGAQYKPVVKDNGEIWYEVIKAN